MSNSQKVSSIGIFDSGFGGLTVMRALMNELPHENIIYFGDTARLPYGNKSAETIRSYSRENAQFLLSHKIKLLVIACHTACSYALEELAASLSIPVIGVIPPSVDLLVNLPKKQKIAILGTRGTIASGIYNTRIQAVLPSSEIFSVACPFFVPLVEEGYTDHPLTHLAVQEYLRPLVDKDLDALLLGCTHYPLLAKAIQKLLPKVTLIDPGIACAAKARKVLTETDQLNSQTTSPHLQFFVSDDPEKFRYLGKEFLNQEIPSVHLI